MEPCFCFSFISCSEDFGFVGPMPGTWKPRDSVRAVVADQAGLMASII
jgi:hypothetical protein